jgi:integrase
LTLLHLYASFGVLEQKKWPQFWPQFNCGHFSMKSELPKTDVRYWQERIVKHSRLVDGTKHEDSEYSVRIAYADRRDRFQLGTANKYEAARKARSIYQRLVAVGWEMTLVEFKPAKAVKPKRSNATIGDFLAALRSLHASRVKTIESYAIALRKIAADISGIPSGGRGGNPENHQLWRKKVESLPLASLTPARIQTWKESFLVRAGADPVKQRAARVSVTSFLCRARSLFAPRMIEQLEDITLPNPLPFAGIRLEKRSMPRYQSTFDVIRLVQAAQEELSQAEPEQYKVFILAVMTGLRRNELDKLLWSAFQWHAGKISIAATEFFHPKSDDSVRDIPLPPEVMELFSGYHKKTQSPFVIESRVSPDMGKLYDHYRCNAIFEKLIAWLRSKGVKTRNPLHTLRKEYGSLITASYGVHAASQLLGHADITTTVQHYVETKGRAVVSLGSILKAPDNIVAFDTIEDAKQKSR